jgi:rubrerythrin
MHNFEQVKDVLDHGRQLHAELRGFYESLNEKEQQARVHLLLDYLSRHERHLEETVARFEGESKRQVLDTWMQYAPSIDVNKLINVKSLAAHGDMSVDEVVRLAIEFDDAMVELYREAADEADISRVKDVFRNLVELESHEKLKMVRDTLMFGDM